MKCRIIKSIRYYGGISGNNPLYIPTEDTIYLGDRIARKLHELGYFYKEFDHVYINPTDKIEHGKFSVEDSHINLPEYKRIKQFNYGLDVQYFNSLKNSDKDLMIAKMTFDVLEKESDEDNLKKVLQVKNEIHIEGKQLKINYKKKITRKYSVSIFYQIGANNTPASLIVEYIDIIHGNLHYTFQLPLQYWEDIYYLIGKILVTNDSIILEPKISFIASINNKKYKTPLILDIKE